jgi:hypothetical protein
MFTPDHQISVVRATEASKLRLQDRAPGDQVRGPPAGAQAGVSDPMHCDAGHWAIWLSVLPRAEIVGST